MIFFLFDVFEIGNALGNFFSHLNWIKNVGHAFEPELCGVFVTLSAKWSEPKGSRFKFETSWLLRIEGHYKLLFYDINEIDLGFFAVLHHNIRINWN